MKILKKQLSNHSLSLQHSLLRNLVLFALNLSIVTFNKVISAPKIHLDEENSIEGQLPKKKRESRRPRAKKSDTDDGALAFMHTFPLEGVQTINKLYATNTSDKPQQMQGLYLAYLYLVILFYNRTKKQVYDTV